MVVAALLSEVRKKPEQGPEVMICANELQIPLDCVSWSDKPDEFVGKPLQIVAEPPHFANRRKFVGISKSSKRVSELQEPFEPLCQQLQWKMMEPF